MTPASPLNCTVSPGLLESAEKVWMKSSTVVRPSLYTALPYLVAAPAIALDLSAAISAGRAAELAMTSLSSVFSSASNCAYRNTVPCFKPVMKLRIGPRSRTFRYVSPGVMLAGLATSLSIVLCTSLGLSGSLPRENMICCSRDSFCPLSGSAATACAYGSALGFIFGA